MHKILLPKCLKPTSVFMPRAKEAAAATIKITKVLSRQASQRNIYNCSKENSCIMVLEYICFTHDIRLSYYDNNFFLKKSLSIFGSIYTQKVRPFFRGYVLDPYLFFRSNKSASSPCIPFSKFDFNFSATPTT